jgi:hypothetical protein
MCEERFGLLDRYNASVLEHARLVSHFTALAHQSQEDHTLKDQLGQVLAEIEISREATLTVRRQLTQHILEHGCDSFPSPVE